MNIYVHVYMKYNCFVFEKKDEFSSRNSEFDQRN
jgi:hypothetical protein